MQVQAVAETQAQWRVPSVVPLVLLIVLPMAAPVVWLAGVLVMAGLRPRGWQATVAMSVGGLYRPLWLYTRTVDGGLATPVGLPLAGLALLGCFAATHRILSR